MKNREQTIIWTSWAGVGINVLLAGFKAVIGLLSNSLAILLDAVNNVTDVFSASVTIIGMKLAAKPADKEHPFGHGRAEYFTAVIISVIIILAAFCLVSENIVGRCYAFEFFFRGFVSRISVRMIFYGELSVSFFNIVERRIFLNA